MAGPLSLEETFSLPTWRKIRALVGCRFLVTIDREKESGNAKPNMRGAPSSIGFLVNISTEGIEDCAYICISSGL